MGFEASYDGFTERRWVDLGLTGLPAKQINVCMVTRALPLKMGYNLGSITEPGGGFLSEAFRATIAIPD